MVGSCHTSSYQACLRRQAVILRFQRTLMLTKSLILIQAVVKYYFWGRKKVGLNWLAFQAHW